MANASTSCLRLCLISIFVLRATNGLAIFLDGEGHYGLRGETRTAPGASSNRGMHQAIDQSFRLQGEARLNEKSSTFLEFRLFEDERSAFLGDDAEAEVCEGDDCSQKPQNVTHPGYKPYVPRVHRAYVRYASDYCLIEAGRRPRSWGMGMFLDAGNTPFSTSHSIFDGISCDINMQKSQTLGISFGYDKLAERGRKVDTKSEEVINFGPSSKNDDVNQYYLAIELDDRRSNAGAAVTKHVGIYAAKVNSGSVSKGGLETDMTLVDLYTGFYIGNISLKSEVLFRLGKSADPNATRLGGARDSGNAPAVNKMQSIGGGLEAEWTFAKSGSSIGPEEFGRGNATHHQVFAGYSYAPGDVNGYYSSTDEAAEEAIHHKNRGTHAKAMAFHQNFSPTLILFNGRKEIDDLSEDGIFDPSRLMNAQLIHFGYRYKDLGFGQLEVQVATATLNEVAPADVTQFYPVRQASEVNKASAADREYVLSRYQGRPIGFYGNDLGWELDLKYWRQFGKEMDVGVGVGYLIPGDAWKTSDGDKPKSNLLVQSYVAFNF